MSPQEVATALSLINNDLMVTAMFLNASNPKRIAIYCTRKVNDAQLRYEFCLEADGEYSLTETVITY